MLAERARGLGHGDIPPGFLTTMVPSSQQVEDSLVRWLHFSEKRKTVAVGWRLLMAQEFLGADQRSQPAGYRSVWPRRGRKCAFCPGSPRSR